MRVSGSTKLEPMELAKSLYSVAIGLTHSGHATLSRYLGLTGTATTLVPTKSEHTGTEINNKNITDHSPELISLFTPPPPQRLHADHVIKSHRSALGLEGLLCCLASTAMASKL